MMITQHDNNGELSCFKSALLFYLRESHPHMADDKAFIRERADSAAEAYEHAIRDGLSVRQALEQADAVLYQDLRFSRFDTVFEVVGLLAAFELLQEAGLHLPQAIGTAVSIIGGLVVGTTAVDARLVSPAALIVTASAGICGFTLPSRDLSDAVRIWRFALAILAGAGGLFALTAGGIALLIHLSGLTRLDVSYLAPFSDARARRAVLRPLLVRQKWRDTALHPQDLKNQGDGHAQ